MKKTAQKNPLSVRMYALLLNCYPAPFKKRFREEMLQTFIDATTDESQTLWFYSKFFWDEIHHIVKEQFSKQKGGENSMRTYSFGLAVCLVMVIAIILTNVVFPQLGHDDYPAVGLMYLAYFLSFVVTGYLSVKPKDSVAKGTKSGAILGFSVMLIMVITYAIIDNLFLDIVSKQPEKIAAFREGHFASMRDAINFGLMKGLLFGTIVGSVFGGILGTIGALIRKFLFSLNK